MRIYKNTYICEYLIKYNKKYILIFIHNYLSYLSQNTFSGLEETQTLCCTQTFIDKCRSSSLPVIVEIANKRKQYSYIVVHVSDFLVNNMLFIFSGLNCLEFIW